VIAVAVFGAIMAMLLVAVVVAPMVEEGRRSRPEPGGEAAVRLEHALEALRRLQFDYETGKLNDEDYAALRREHAADAIAARDELASQAPAESGAPAGEPSCATCGSVVARSVQFCTHCGSPVLQPSAESDAPPG
jgi:hypothetical protein